jgi:hypothetical protein
MLLMLGLRSRKLLNDAVSEGPTFDSEDDGNMAKLSSEL